MSRFQPFSDDPLPDGPMRPSDPPSRAWSFDDGDPPEPFVLFWNAWAAAEAINEHPEERADYEENAREMELNVFATIVCSFLSPCDRPEWCMVVETGLLCGESVFTLGALKRDVTAAYVWIIRPQGAMVEHGWMQAVDGSWDYLVQDPAGVRSDDTVFVMVVGVPWPNG